MIERTGVIVTRGLIPAGAALGMLIAAIAGSAYAADETDDPYAVFRAHDEDSNIRLTYPDWDFFLERTVLVTGPSHRYSPKKPDKNTGTRISRTNTSPSWVEGNRVVFDRLSDEGIQMITDFRMALEGIPDQVAMERWSRDEQLAYWLNLYNVTVYEQIALKYPYKNMKRLHEGRGSMWEEKLLKVSGVPLSLNDIQNEILIPNYQDPRVVYGLFRGMVGGPNLRRKAFTGPTVWAELEENAAEFVNSIRGVHAKGDGARASLLYEWCRPLFTDFQADLRRHLNQYADAETAEILANADSIEAEYFDWAPADLYDGDPNAARMMPTMFGTGVIGSPHEGISNSNVPTGGFGNPGSGGEAGVAAGRGFSDNLGNIGISPEAGLPLHTQALLRAIQTKFEIFGYPETFITIEEVERSEEDEEAGEDESGEPEN